MKTARLNLALVTRDPRPTSDDGAGTLTRVISGTGSVMARVLEIAWPVVDSTSGQGGRAEAQAEGSNEALPAPGSRSSRDTTTKERWSILCLDDEPAVLRSLVRQLDGLGMEVYTATTSFEALKLVREHSPTVLLVDFNLGDDSMDGIEFMERAKRMVPDSAMIMLTGFPEGEVPAQALRVGVFSFLVKPCDETTLRSTVLNAVETIRLRHENKELYERLLDTTRELDELKRRLRSLTSI